jgi:hypothetical protein
MRNNGLIKCPKTVYQEQRRCLVWVDFNASTEKISPMRKEVVLSEDGRCGQNYRMSFKI